MVKRYDSGLTEADQVEKAGTAVLYIADDLGTRDVCADAWQAMVDAESLVRAACRSTRGHARHVLNVFWMGYYILHHPELRTWTERLWNTLVNERQRMGPVSKMAPAEALSAVWFYVAVFHDFTYLLEKSCEIQRYHLGILPKFGDLGVSAANQQDYFAADLVDRLPKFLRKEFDDPRKEDKKPDSPSVAALKEVCVTGLSAKAPDHGLMSALHFHRMRLNDPQQSCLVAEAARAMALHHVACEVPRDKIGELLSWPKEPLACLLLLCDQLQTWDRERHDRTFRHDLPERAELSRLDVSQSSGEIRVNMAIDYIAPSHLERSPDIFGRVKDDLDQILAKYPKPALERLAGDWPFHLEVSCTMSGVAMNTKMSFPRKVV